MAMCITPTIGPRYLVATFVWLITTVPTTSGLRLVIGADCETNSSASHSRVRQQFNVESEILNILKNSRNVVPRSKLLILFPQLAQASRRKMPPRKRTLQQHHPQVQDVSTVE